jgi:hypothetical protein
VSPPLLEEDEEEDEEDALVPRSPVLPALVASSTLA